MYAVIQTGGKQYQALEGKTLAIEKLDLEDGTEVVFSDVLLRRTDEKTVEVGTPFVSTPVKAIVLKQIKGPKVIVFHFKRRKRIHKEKGHRQPQTIIRITSI
jgi:large subunit ribosomal protein L21